MKRNVLLYGICFSCFLLFACAYKGPLVTPDRLVYSSREMLEILVSRFGTDFPLEIKVPYDSNSTLDAYAMDTIRLHTTDEEKFNMIVDSIFSGSLELAYEQNETNTAIETFATSQGNCLSLTNLFIALSRHAGLETFYVEVLDNVSWTAEGRLVYNNGHIVAGMKIYKLRINNKKFPTNLITVDFYPSRPKKYRKLKPIDDLTAVTYYYNNMGVHLLQQKKHIQALHLFNNLLKLNRAQDKVYNNLGVTYSRMGDYTRAIASY